MITNARFPTVRPTGDSGSSRALNQGSCGSVRHTRTGLSRVGLGPSPPLRPSPPGFMPYSPGIYHIICGVRTILCSFKTIGKNNKIINIMRDKARTAIYCVLVAQACCWAGLYVAVQTGVDVPALLANIPAWVCVCIVWCL